MSTKLPLDVNDNPIPALRLKDSGAHKITSSGTSARNSVAFSEDTRVVSVYATHAVYLNFGGGSVTASNSDHYFPAGVYYDVALGGDGAPHASYVAALQVTQGGTVYISEKV